MGTRLTRRRRCGSRRRRRSQRRWRRRCSRLDRLVTLPHR